MKRVLICGISGQDGSLLAKLLLDKGYEVYGTSRDAQITPFQNLIDLGIREQVACESMSGIDFHSVLQVLDKIRPDEIYNLSGQSSVGLSFQLPIETIESHANATLNLLESIRLLKLPVRVYNASSGECFGDTYDIAANEETAFRPKNPYAIGKAAAHWQTVLYRDAYQIECCSGILFNHESPLRPERFVTRKIVASACRIANGNQEKLQLGKITIERDWGWAAEYVDAMWRMLQVDAVSDFVICTGEPHSLEEFIAEAFACVDLDWREHVIADESNLRPLEAQKSFGDPGKAEQQLGWVAKYKMKDVVRELVKAELSREVK